MKKAKFVLLDEHICVMNDNIDRTQIWIFKGKQNVIIEISGK
jgi:hypothetical protein